MNLGGYAFLSILLITGLLLTSGCTTAHTHAIPPGKTFNAAQQAPRSTADVKLNDTIAVFDTNAEKARQL
ncbi:MAG: hypothetical protein WC593_13970 [Methanoregula sp.]